MDKYDIGLAIEVNQTRLVPKLESSIFQTYRSPLKFNSLDGISAGRGIECISIDNTGTTGEGRASISRIRIIVKQNELSGNESSSFRLAKEQQRTCGGTKFRYTWNYSWGHQNCADVEFETMKSSSENEILPRGHETPLARTAFLPLLLAILLKCHFITEPFHTLWLHLGTCPQRQLFSVWEIMSTLSILFSLRITTTVRTMEQKLL